MDRIGIIFLMGILKRSGFSVILVLLTLVTGCRDGPDQAAVEYDGAAFFAKRIGFHERQFPNIRITNLQQVFVGTEVPYSERWHYQFLRFGKHAGFEASFFEKYAFVEHPFTNSAIVGEIALLNSEPFPDRQGRLGRMLLSKTTLSSDGWMIKWYPEDQIQEMFRAAGQSIPKPPGPIPPPYALVPPQPPPLPARVEKYFEDIAANYGPGRAGGKPLMWITFTLVMVVVFLLSWLGWRKWR